MENRTIRKSFFAYLILLISAYSYCQQNYSDEKLLNDVIPYVVNRVSPTVTYYIEEKPCAFFDQKNFFTKQHFETFTQPLLGLNNRSKQLRKKRIEELIKKLDFEYLANYKADTIKWNLASVKHDQIVKNGTSGGYCEIAKPIFSKNNKYLFIYYQRGFKAKSGATMVSSTNAVIFKKKKGKWIFHVYIGVLV